MNPATSDTSASSSPGASPRADHQFGEYTECELCQTERHCTDRYGMVTCRDCQRALLP